MLQLAIVGAGPIGIACALLAKEFGIESLLLEKGSVANTIRRFPTDMLFHSTADRLGLPGIPLITKDAEPTRQEMLKYLNAVVRMRDLNVRCFSEVVALDRDHDGFLLTLASGERIPARNVVVATGYYENPNLLGVPGEDLPHVSHTYLDPYAATRARVVIVGGGNSACETALELYRAGATVSVVHRQPDFSPTLKYWIRPDIENRIERGEIARFPSTVVTEILPAEIRVRSCTSGEERSLPADFVYALTGFQPMLNLLRTVGARIDESSLVPEHDPSTFESSVSGVFIAGSIVAGRRINQIFIENGYVHAEHIVSAIVRKATR